MSHLKGGLKWGVSVVFIAKAQVNELHVVLSSQR